MRIPLDYYRILGLPIQATAEQLHQAHRDRTLQLPRREYSEAAITARRQLIDEAYDILSSPEERQAYDANFLANSFELETEAASSSSTELGVAGATASDANPTTDPYTPTIEIEDDQLVGALLILLELGEYELVIKLGRPYLSSGSVDLRQGRFGDPDTVLADIVLTVALACLELGREQWQQGQYENAAESLDTGQELLRREGLFETIRSEIQVDLYKLRPYRILELLSLPETRLNERRQGLQLLQRMLQDRGGIDGNGDDLSGLNIDDFLRFMQQLRKYLTAAEQQTLFEAEARRPSAVATYLAVYALLARGFAQQQPALIRRAKQMLIRLGSRQDVHLEQAVCALLLGQTEEASRALELSQEYEPLAFIREHSQGAPDLLPGLCLYAERWLQQEVFPHFRDLAHQSAFLKDYFANEHVQAYLEALPNEAEAVPVSPRQVNSPAFTASRTASPDMPSIAEDIRDWRTQHLEHRDPAADVVPAATATVPPPPTEPKPYRSQSKPINGAGGNGSNGATRHAPSATVEHVSQLSPEGNLKPGSAARQVAEPLKGDAPPRSVPPAKPRKRVPAPVEQLGAQRPGGRGRSPRLDRLGLVVFVFLVSIAALGFLFSRAFSRFTAGNDASLSGEQLQIQLDRPILEIPDPTSDQFTQELTLEQARQVLESWFSAKQAAFGPDHQTGGLEEILADPELSERLRRAEEIAQTESYWGYEHELLEVSVTPDENNPDQAVIEAQVYEKGDFYKNGLIEQSQSYDDELRVRYDVVRQDDGWRIRAMDVVP